jgi:DNA-directed RNA polymerase subunit F
MNQKYSKRDGTVSVYKVKNKKWIKSNRPYKPQKKGLEKKSIYSARFGFLEMYNRKEQQSLVCPSGHSISQCFNAMRKLWLGYHISRCQEKNLENMIKYARAIQSVQKDLGIKITSFPHLGIYGDVLILNNKQGERIAFENHSELKEKQEKFEKWQDENAKKIQEKLQKPDKEKGESIVTFVDDVSPYQITEGEETVPDLLEPDEEEGEEEIVRADDIPFQNNQNGNQAENTKKIQEKLQKPDKEKGESIVTFVDDVSAH